MTWDGREVVPRIGGPVKPFQSAHQPQMDFETVVTPDAHTSMYDPPTPL